MTTKIPIIAALPSLATSQPLDLLCNPCFLQFVQHAETRIDVRQESLRDESQRGQVSGSPAHRDPAQDRAGENLPRGSQHRRQHVAPAGGKGAGGATPPSKMI